jgi:vitamin B12/bleomycin/antimicrobial peptide transport system ATP-binding/permease protein
LRNALTRCELAHLIGSLDQRDGWSHVLSGGEQQRLAFARLLVDPPDILIIDEVTSALDEVGEAKMMELLKSDLAAVTVIGVARRSGLAKYFDREIILCRGTGITRAIVPERQDA